jgi:hypothetical protein
MTPLGAFAAFFKRSVCSQTFYHCLRRGLLLGTRRGHKVAKLTAYSSKPISAAFTSNLLGRALAASSSACAQQLCFNHPVLNQGLLFAGLFVLS